MMYSSLYSLVFSMRFGKPIARGTFAYKAGTGAPPVKVSSNLHIGIVLCVCVCTRYE